MRELSRECDGSIQPGAKAPGCYGEHRPASREAATDPSRAVRLRLVNAVCVMLSLLRSLRGSVFYEHGVNTPCFTLSLLRSYLITAMHSMTYGTVAPL
ncbi:hypothetical protein Pla52n_08570 [Stieleria varia]|uniref:Uncharacterized protein n=1 Tax=Stieleria varia TaxID=2528005 RepID=A0A5C6B7N9_9BACT|nr:hypothetical protein Pla52n_08570 [Stieleria varia]